MVSGYYYNYRADGEGMFIKSAIRVLLLFGHFATWAMVLLLAIWPAGDAHPQTTAMFLAIQHGNLSATDEFLRGGVDVNSRDESGITPLMAAARGGHIDVVRRLLAAGARIDACVPVWGTPLMVAAVSGQHDVMRELVARGANVDAVSPTGQTALWIARMAGDEKAVRILTAAGAVAEGRCAVPNG
jgi:ankyrin repeat protein